MEGISCPGGRSEGVWVGLGSKWQMVIREEATWVSPWMVGRDFPYKCSVGDWGCCGSKDKYRQR